MALEERFWAKVNKTDTCWLWTACKTLNGYGRFRVTSNKAEYAHRVAFGMAGHVLPRGMFLDHTCYTRECVRPDHLRPVTRKQNMENREGAASSSLSGYRGVHWDSRQRKWRASVRHNSKAHHAGRFDSPEEANRAVIALRNKLFTHNEQDR